VNRIIEIALGIWAGGTALGVTFWAAHLLREAFFIFVEFLAWSIS